MSVVDLPGVGANLQDRYEVAVVSCFARDFALIDQATFAPPDPTPDTYMQEWLQNGNGRLCLQRRAHRHHPPFPAPTSRSRTSISLVCPAASAVISLATRNYSSITTTDSRGRFSRPAPAIPEKSALQSAQPWDTPAINFQYFGDGGRANDPDLDAVSSGVQFVREMNQRLQTRRTHHRRRNSGAGLCNARPAAPVHPQ